MLDVTVPAESILDTEGVSWPIAFTRTASIKGIAGLIQNTKQIIPIFNWNGTSALIRLYNISSTQQANIRVAWVAFGI